MSITINNQTYQAIIFDVDDTLIDTSESYDEAIKRTVKNYTHFEINDTDIELVRKAGIFYGVNNDWNVTRLLIDLINTFPKAKWELALKNQALAKIDASAQPFIEMKNFFQNIYLGQPHFNGQGLIDTAERQIYHEQFFPTLQSFGVKIAVVTSRPANEALYSLQTVNGLVGQFIESKDFIISVGSKNSQGQLIAEKPSPAPLLECVNRLPMKPSDCTYVGNSTSDYLAARAAKIDFIQVGSSLIERDNEPTGFNYLKLDNVNEILTFSS